MLLELQSPISPLIVIEIKFVQFLKAELPIDAIPLGMVRYFIYVFPAKALEPIVRILYVTPP